MQRWDGDPMPDEAVRPDNPEAFARLMHPRRPFTPAPSEGPTSDSVPQVEPSGDPTRLIGGQTSLNNFVGRGAPLLPPSPAPSPPSLFRVPTVYENPNMREFELQGYTESSRRGERSPVASPAAGEQLAYELREDWRRPASIVHAPETPGGE